MKSVKKLEMWMLFGQSYSTNEIFTNCDEPDEIEPVKPTIPPKK